MSSNKSGYKFKIPTKIIRHINWRGTLSDLESVFMSDEEEKIWVNNNTTKMIKKKLIHDYFVKIDNKNDLSSSDSEHEKSMVKSWSKMDKNDIIKVKNNVKNTEIHDSDDDFIVNTQPDVIEKSPRKSEMSVPTIHELSPSDDSLDMTIPSNKKQNLSSSDSQESSKILKNSKISSKYDKNDKLNSSESSKMAKNPSINTPVRTKYEENHKSSDAEPGSSKMSSNTPENSQLEDSSSSDVEQSKLSKILQNSNITSPLSPEYPQTSSEVKKSPKIVQNSPKSIENIQKSKKKSLTMKDFVIPSPRTSNIHETSIVNTESNMTNVLDILDLGTESNQLFMEDIDSNDEMYILQCPKEVDYMDLKDQAISLSGESFLKFGSQNFESFTQKDDIGRVLNVVLPSRTSRTFSMGLFPLAGSIILTESMDVPEIKEFETIQHEKIPLPDFKDIHKLYSDFSDSSYKDSTKSSDVKKKKKRETLKVESPIKNVLPTKNKSKELNESSKLNNTIQSEDIEISYVKKKKKKESVENSHNLDISTVSIMDNTLNGGDEICIKKKKKKSYMDDNDEINFKKDDSELITKEEILNGGDIELSHKKKKKKKSHMDESFINIPTESEYESTEHKKKKKKKHDIDVSQNTETSHMQDNDVKKKKKKKNHEIDLNDSNMDRKRKREDDYEFCQDLKKLKSMDYETILVNDNEITKSKKKKKKYNDQDMEMNLSRSEEMTDVDKPKKKKKHKKQEEIEPEIIEIVEHKKKKKEKKRQEAEMGCIRIHEYDELTGRESELEDF